MSHSRRRTPSTVAAPVRSPPSRPLPRLPERALPCRALRVHRGGQESVLRLDERERYVLGRHDAADVVFDAPEVSRLHGVLRYVDSAWHFEDYGSVNGSALHRLEGEAPVAPHTPVALGAGDLVILGGADARIELLIDVDDEERGDGPLDTATSSAARAFAERVRLAARTRVPVFLLGPSGVGKTHTARQIHEASHLPGPFVPLNCARLPADPSALHSELLGHVKGAYTGAESARTGKLVLADGGTLFLDEVESLPPLAQGFLLDVLEGAGDLSPLGAQAPRLKPVAFRLVAASKKPLAQSGLRGDLCERLAEGHLWRVPGIDERRADIPAFVRRFAQEQESMLGVPIVVAAGALRFCAAASWPGQLRQLRATVIALAQLGLARALERGEQAEGSRLGVTLREADFAAHLAEREAAFGDRGDVVTKADARRLTRAQAEAAVRAAGGSRAAAARNLGVSRNSLARRLREP